MTRQGLEALQSVVRKQVEVEGLRKLADRLEGVEVGQIRSIRDGRDPKGSTVLALCRALGLEFYVGPLREEAAALDIAGDDATQAALRGIGDIEESAQRLVESVLAAGGNPFPRDLHDEAVLPLVASNEAPRGARPIDIAEIDTTVGGDAGSDSERVIDVMWFTRAWLEQRRVEPRGCAIMRISGDSMEPTLPDGSSILVDRNRRDRIDFRVYVVRTGAGLMVKRAVEQRGEWLLASDNPEVAPLRWLADAEIVGEVLWVGHTLLDSASHVKHKPRLDFSRWGQEPSRRAERSEAPEHRKFTGRRDP